MPLKQSRIPKMSKIIPKGKPTIVTQRIIPTSDKIAPIPKVTSFPHKEKTSPTKIQTNLNGNKIRFISKLIINIPLLFFINHSIA